ncbi:glycoside hydrolase family 20 zincin-like fold domain-containing protein [Chitinophaga sp. MM2321]|uniref:glycoside hydrolase family 20 zincin-like fold domain-containing protein n=1 Tax=Chitinophaga sp. MM2321 TaxID=3137178 RepID=UPI0032D5963F
MKGILTMLLCIPLFCAGTILQRVTIVSKDNQVAAQVLQEEVKRRTGLQWSISTEMPASGDVIVFTAVKSRPESYRIRQSSDKGRRITRVEGDGTRGLLYGAGYLLRVMEYNKQGVVLPDIPDVEVVPEKAIRGHQIGYRNLANSYDGWTPEQYEQYIRDLAIFGANSIEAIPFMPPSPHFTIPSMDMNLRISGFCKKYDLDFSVWTPATFDLKDAVKRKNYLLQFDTLLRQAVRLDAVFFPGGDPGDNKPQEVLPLLEELSVSLKKYHPKAQIWLSLQGYDPEDCAFVYSYIHQNKPTWLGGIVVGPSSPSLEDTRAALPAMYKIRHYPDITHTVRCDYPVVWWDPAFALTLGREPVNPQPVYYANIYRYIAPYMDGFISYSDGAHDDLNKMVWSMLGWNTGADVREILIQYTNYFFGSSFREEAADGILALEKNWEGAIADNGGIPATLSLWQKQEQDHPELAGNWRWQMFLLRAYYDAYTRARAIREAGLEAAVNRTLLESGDAIGRAEKILQQADKVIMPQWRNRIIALCDDLYKSVALQTSVAKYKAAGAERGAVLDFLDRPLNNRWWLEDKFRDIRTRSKTEQRKALDTIAHWENPGPGSFYDNVGNVSKSSHVVRTEDLHTDPLILRSDAPGFDWWESGYSRRRLSWMVSMRWPSAMRYDHLDTTARYIIRVTGNGESLLRANGERLKPTLYNKGIGEIKEFPVPPALSKTGTLVLTWDSIDEEHLNWRQHSRVSEVWLIKL